MSNLIFLTKIHKNNMKNFVYFIVGVFVGTIVGLLIGDEEKKQIRKFINCVTEKLRKECKKAMPGEER